MTMGSRLFKDRAAESVVRDAWSYELEERNKDEALLAELALPEDIEARLRARLSESRIGYIGLMIEGVLYEPTDENYLLRRLPEVMAAEQTVKSI